MPDATEIASWYDASYFTSDAANALGSNHLAVAEAGMEHGTEPFRQLSRRIQLRGRRVLEIGCGGGAFISQCAEAGAIVSGLEISAFAADRLRARYGFDVRVGTVQSNPFGDERFDLVAFTDVIEHVLSPTEFLSGLGRLLTPGGFAFGLLPNIDSVAHYGPGWAGFRYHAEHLYYLGNRQVQRYLSKAGFRAKEIWTHGEPWEPSTETRSAPSPIWKQTLRKVPGLLATVRAARTGLAQLKRETRLQRTRYRNGLGHDLYFLAEKA